MEGVGLVVPVGEEHMYYAAMNSTACRLTALGPDVRDDLRWNLSGISQEAAEQAHGAELHCIDQTVLLGETGDVVEVVDGECPVPSKLLI